jgi:hypothetical protein
MERDINKDRITSINKKLIIFGILFLLIITPLVFEINTKAADDIEWEIKLNFSEPGGTYDYVIFGEKPDANNGGNPDFYDMPKPPAPISPNIRAWFDNNLTEPYNLLLADYRKSPDTNKIWTLSVLWSPLDESSTTITIKWNIENITNLEYDSIKFYEEGNTNPIFDMLDETSYSYFFPANELQHFQIICQNENTNGKTENTEILSLYLIFTLIIIIIIALLIVYWKIKR